MHAESHLTLQDLLKTEPIQPRQWLNKLSWLFVIIGTVVFTIGISFHPPQLFWASYYTSALFFSGLAVGGVMISVIVQIVRAKWAPPVRRIAEANVAFLPWAYIAILTTYAGREYLFPWGRGPMPGREMWMQPEFVYLRFAVLLGFLFFMMWRYVRMSLRGDIGLLRERMPNKDRWQHISYDGLVANWKGAEREVPVLQRKLSWNAPLLVALYAVIYSLFVFEMLMGMDIHWMSNMFGGFEFVGNILLGWAVLAITVIALARGNHDYGKVVTTNHLWDLGKLTLGFCMLWAYMFFSQFLPQWYGNVPEETQWMILRTREMPWMGLGYATFALCWVIPFVLFMSDDLKKTPIAFTVACLLIFCGIWLEKYVIIMPFFSPHEIPFSYIDIGLFLGFLGAYILSVQWFRARYPFIGISHPVTYGDTNW